MAQGRWPAVHGRQRSLVSRELARRWCSSGPTWTMRADRTRQEGEVVASGIERTASGRRDGGGRIRWEAEEAVAAAVAAESTIGLGCPDGTILPSSENPSRGDRTSHSAQRERSRATAE